MIHRHITKRLAVSEKPTAGQSSPQAPPGEINYRLSSLQMSALPTPKSTFLSMLASGFCSRLQLQLERVLLHPDTLDSGAPWQFLCFRYRRIPTAFFVIFVNTQFILECW